MASPSDLPLAAPATAELCQEIRVVNIPGEGRTLCVREAVGVGQHLFRERPAFVADSREQLAEDVATALADDRDALAPVVVGIQNSGLNRLASDVVARFSFEFLDGANVALFRVLGLMNHACAGSEEANCCLSVPFDAGTVSVDEPVTVVAVRPVPAGGVLRISYLCPFAPRSRLQELQTAHQFECHCSSCKAGPQSLVERCCAACANSDAYPNVVLKRCGACKEALYCCESCQRHHRPEHRRQCKQAGSLVPFSEARETEDFLKLVQASFEEVMAASCTALGAGSAALQSRKRFEGEQALESSLALTDRFLSRFESVASMSDDGSERPMITNGSSRRFASQHSFIYYAKGNAVKLTLTRLAMRFRLRGAEPCGGCGALANKARSHLASCLASATLVLPAWHVEFLSLLRDVIDLGQLASDLLGLAADLKVWGEANEGSIDDHGLDSVVEWSAGIVNERREVLVAYGEKVSCDFIRRDTSSLLRVDVDDDCVYTLDQLRDKYRDEYSEQDINVYWENLEAIPQGDCHRLDFHLGESLDDVVADELVRDLSHFNAKFGCRVWLSHRNLRGLADLMEDARDELRHLCQFYKTRCATCGQDPQVASRRSGPESSSQKREATVVAAQDVAESPLRFLRGDRVICNLGLYWGAGTVLGTDVPDPEDPEGPSFPYMIKLDASTGFSEPTPVATDTDDVVRREVCFDLAIQLEFIKVAAPLPKPGADGCKLPLRFSPGVRVGCRVEDTDGGVALWERGVVEKVWYKLPPPHQLPYGRRTAEKVPYVVKLESGRVVVAHRDDHTLVRQEENIPQIPCVGIASRFETRQQRDGTRVKFDHVTLRFRLCTDTSTTTSEQ